MKSKLSIALAASILFALLIFALGRPIGSGGLGIGVPAILAKLSHPLTGKHKEPLFAADGGAEPVPYWNFFSWLQNGIARINAHLSIMEKNLLSYHLISLSGQYHVTQDELNKILERQGKWIWQQPPPALLRRIEDLPWVEKAKMSILLYPLRIAVTLQEADPWLVAEYQGSSWLVSVSGKLIQPLQTIKDPSLIIDTSEFARIDGLRPEEGADSLLRSENARFVYAVKMLKFFEMAGGFPFKVERYTLLPDGSLLVLPANPDEQPQLVLSASTLTDAERELRKLKLVLADLKRRGERAQKIDLRFENQAVVK